MDRHFKWVDAKSGKVLWDFESDSGIIGQPVTYLGPDGRQYVAILAGVGGWAGAVVAGQLDPRDPSAALGFGREEGTAERRARSRQSARVGRSRFLSQ